MVAARIRTLADEKSVQSSLTGHDFVCPVLCTELSLQRLDPAHHHHHHHHHHQARKKQFKSKNISYMQVFVEIFCEACLCTTIVDQNSLHDAHLSAFANLCLKGWKVSSSASGEAVGSAVLLNVLPPPIHITPPRSLMTAEELLSDPWHAAMDHPLRLSQFVLVVTPEAPVTTSTKTDSSEIVGETMPETSPERGFLRHKTRPQHTVFCNLRATMRRIFLQNQPTKHGMDTITRLLSGYAHKEHQSTQGAKVAPRRMLPRLRHGISHVLPKSQRSPSGRTHSPPRASLRGATSHISDLTLVILPCKNVAKDECQPRVFVGSGGVLCDGVLLQLEHTGR
jgi:hypothetical protein